ncbi:diguanylate cyclase, partial [bacterium]
GTTTKGTGGVDSYSYFHRRLTEEIERAGRLNERMSLLLVGGDSTGRAPANEEFFGEVLSRVKGMMRGIDVVGRYGGSQVILYLPETAGEAAQKAAERIRGRVERMGEDNGTGTTVSIGLVTLPENGETVEQLMNALTSALFKAQQAGGNRASGPAEMYVL